MTTLSFIAAKYAALMSMKQEARDVIQDIVKDEFQRMVSKTDIQKMNVPMSQKVLSALVVGDVDTLASTALSVDVIHDTIAPLKTEIGKVCNDLGVDENAIRAIASGNPEEIANIALKKLDVDPNLFTLMVNIARKDVQASLIAFRKVCVAVLGKKDEPLFDLCEGIIQILIEKEGSEISEVILKKIVTKLLLYTKSKMINKFEEEFNSSEIDKQFKNFSDSDKDKIAAAVEKATSQKTAMKKALSHINTDFIFALNSLSFSNSSDVLLELLALVFRIADEKLYSTLRNKDLKYDPMFAQIFKLCKEIFQQSGKLRSAICDTEKPGQLLEIILKSILEHLRRGAQKNVKELSTKKLKELLKNANNANNVEEIKKKAAEELNKQLSRLDAENTFKDILKVFRAISELATTEDSFEMRKLISQKITEHIATFADDKVDKNVQDIISDIIETGIAVIAIDGAINIEDCMNRVIKRITMLPEYKKFIKDNFGEIYANKLTIACQMFTSIVFPHSLKTLTGIETIAKKLSFTAVKERKILATARSMFNALMNHPDLEVMCNGVPLVQEIGRRGKILKTMLIPFLDISAFDKKALALFINLFSADDALVRTEMGVLWTTIGFPHDAKNFLNAIMECCMFQRDANLCNVIDIENSKIRATELLLKSLKVVLDDETNRKWKQKLGPILLDFCENLEETEFDQLDNPKLCDKFHSTIFNVWPRFKLLVTVSCPNTPSPSIRLI